MAADVVRHWWQFSLSYPLPSSQATVIFNRAMGVTGRHLLLAICLPAALFFNTKNICHGSPVAVPFLATLRGGSLQSRRWERMDGKALGSGTGASRRGESLRSSLQSVSGGRACSLYVWDAPSSLLHKWCQHLLKDCVYEGLGGQKFVRIEPGSILQLLYPCSRYSPDRCVLCGGTHRDHLTLWWGKHLYTPFDQSMEKTYASGSVLEPKFPALPKPKRSPRQGRSHSVSSSSSSRKSYTNRGPKRGVKNSRSRSTSPRTTEPPMIRSFAFHRLYVTDFETLAQGITDKKERTRKLRRELTKIQAKTGARMEIRMLTDKNLAYVVSAAASIDGPKRSQSITSLFSRYVVLNAIDRLIGMQETENDNIRQKERANGCC